LQAPIGITKLTSGDGEAWKSVKSLGQGAQRFRFELRIVVQEKNEFGRCNLDPGIDGPGKSGVAWVAKDNDFWKLLEQIGERVVVASVINENDPGCGDALAHSRGDTGQQHWAAVVVDDDHGETGAWFDSLHRRAREGRSLLPARVHLRFRGFTDRIIETGLGSVKKRAGYFAGEKSAR